LVLSGGIYVISSAWLLALQKATSAGLLSTQINRKVVHITCAPFLMLFWPLYSDAATSRLAAALVPLAFTARLLVSAIRNRRVIETGPHEAAEVRSVNNLTASITRTADDSISEALQGPLAYLVVLSGLTLFCWRDSAVAAVVVGQLCFGDGFADIVGRTFGKGSEWKYKLARGKTVVGSTAFSFAGFIGSSALISFLQHAGCIPNSLSKSWTIPALVLISVLCGAVEVLFPDVDDNYSVSFTAAVLAVFFRL
jgi:phytol kinase